MINLIKSNSFLPLRIISTIVYAIIIYFAWYFKIHPIFLKTTLEIVDFCRLLPFTRCDVKTFERLNYLITGLTKNLNHIKREKQLSIPFRLNYFTAFNRHKVHSSYILARLWPRMHQKEQAKSANIRTVETCRRYVDIKIVSYGVSDISSNLMLYKEMREHSWNRYKSPLTELFLLLNYKIADRENLQVDRILRNEVTEN